MRKLKDFKLPRPLETVYYFSLVRCLLEYASVLWDLFVVVDSHHLQRDQTRFLAFAAYM